MSDTVGMCVALSIDLNSHPDLIAVEVQNVGADRVLATKAQVGQPPSAKPGPEKAFGQGEAAAKIASTLDGLSRSFHVCNLTWN